MANNVLVQTHSKPFILSDKQASIFAMAIAPDIGEYIQTHKEEFEVWLKNQPQIILKEGITKKWS